MTEKKKTTEPGNEVEISSLGTLEPFKYHGQWYTKRHVKSGGIKALSLKGDKLITLAPDTLVTVEKPTEPETPTEPGEGETETTTEPGEEPTEPGEEPTEPGEET